MVDSKLTMPVNFKGSQPQIQRIKKQDEEDHWISEEELYTEGSSDEEKPVHSSRKQNLKGRKSETRNKTHSHPLSSVILCGSEKSQVGDCPEVNDSNAVQRDISWRPKRGSIKLPGVDLSEITHSSDTH